MARQIISQIATIVNDAFHDAIGQTALASAIETTDFVSMGKALGDGQSDSSISMYERWFGSLANRLVRTVYAVRVFNPKSRGILREDTEWGAYVQKVHYGLSNADDNPAFEIPAIDSSTGARTYNQQSPYDVNNSPEIRVLMFGGQGTWSDEIVRPIAQIMTAFTGEAEMLSFISGIYTYLDNSMKVQIEALERVTANTGIASVINSGRARNLLSEYNATLPAGATALTVATCLKDKDFLRYFSQQVVNTVKYMEDMSVGFNSGHMPKFTPREYNVVEILTAVASASEMYLESDTFHNELVALPRYTEVNFWQTQGTNGAYAFADVSKISIQHDDFINAEDETSTGTITQGGILAYIHDIDALACYFGERYTWEEVNKRQRVVIHGEQARKGYAVDNNENQVVFYIAD